MTTRPPGVRRPPGRRRFRAVDDWVQCALCYSHIPLDTAVAAVHSVALFCEQCANVVCANCDNELSECECRVCPEHGGYRMRPGGCPMCAREEAGDAEPAAQGGEVKTDNITRGETLVWHSANGHRYKLSLQHDGAYLDQTTPGGCQGVDKIDTVHLTPEDWYRVATEIERWAAAHWRKEER